MLIDMQDICRRYSFDIICQFSFGLDPRSERAMVVSPLYWKLKRFLNVGSERKLKEAISVDVDDKYLRDIVINFLLAGRDTIASTLTDFFLLLSYNPRVEEKIRVELDSIMKPTQESPTFEQTREFHYVNSAIKKYRCFCYKSSDILTSC
uniref:E-class P450, group I n=1 Tax=Medicago truncatula TaxID=3880 RepID=A2Q3J6_MEDTR|nr:E-class P450, group I [Medicago truncatula]